MRGGWIAIAGVLLVGCGGEGGPPLAELPLRDALSATPEAIAQLPESERRTLAERLESARKQQQPDEATPNHTTAADEVRSVDESRLGRGADAIVVARDLGPALHVHVDDGAPSSEPLPALEGPAATGTAADEARAIDGRAGEILVELARVSGARHLVRVTQWPIGAIAVGDTIYVNASWLVALAAMGDGDASVHRPALQPAAIQGTPYRTYDTLAACTNDVSARCGNCVSSGTDCDEDATLSDFPNGRAECEWLVADQQRIPQLCALALMSISSVARCVTDRSGCSIPAGTTNSAASLSAATVFLSKSSCVQALNVCLSGSTSTAIAPDGGTSSSAPRSSEGCQDPFSACASSLKGCNQSCKSGSCSGKDSDSCSGTKCSSCNEKNGSSSGDSCGGCSSSEDSSSSSSSGSKSSSNCNKCESGRPVSPIAPFVPPVTLAVPLLYLLVRARRTR